MPKFKIGWTHISYYLYSFIGFDGIKPVLDRDNFYFKSDCGPNVVYQSLIGLMARALILDMIPLKA